MSDRITKETELPEPGESASEKPISRRGSPSAAHARARKGLTRTVVAGAGWLVAWTVGARVIGFASQIVLAWILAPTDFAILALAWTVTVIIDTLVNFGVDDVLLQRQRAMRFWTTSAFLLSLGAGVAGMLLVVAASPLAVHLYDAPILYTVLPIMAAAMPLTALSAVPAAKIRAALDFRFLATYATIELAIGQVAVIILALNGFGVLSFVLPGPVLAAARTITFWISARPRLGPMRPKQLRMMGKAGSAVFGTKFLTAMVGQGDYFVLGLFASKPEVGAYFLAFRLAIQPVQMLAGNLSTVLFPALAQLRNDFVRQREAALSACRVLAFAIMPYCFMQSAVARPVVDLLFGAKWDAAIVPLEILSIGTRFRRVLLDSPRSAYRSRRVSPVIPLFLCLFAGLFRGCHHRRTLGVRHGCGYRGQPVLRRTLALLFLRRIQAHGGAVARCRGHLFGSDGVRSRRSRRGRRFGQLVPAGPLAQIAIIAAFGGGVYLGLVRLLDPSRYKQVMGRLREAIRSK